MSYIEQLTELEAVPTSEEAAFYKLLGYNIRKARQKKGWEQANLSDAMGISQSQMSKFETGGNRIPLFDLLRVAQVLDVRWQSLVP